MSKTIVSLDQITAEDERRCGAKAYNCARLLQAGFPVPDGLVVPANATDGDLSAVVEHPWFDRLPEDTLFAVRSSGIGEDSEGQSFAGLHETRLHVPRAEVREAVLACRASARSEQALAYRRAKGLPTDTIEIGVLIQRMIAPVAAGVAFTINPVTFADDQIVINASWGVGEALVSGQIEPDEFGVRKQDAEILWEQIGDKAGAAQGPKASLTRAEVRELAGLLVSIERHYSAPQDVEWCHDGAAFWIVQSRPVTTGRPRIEETEWTRANLAEVLPEITSPQVVYALAELLDRAERMYMGKLMGPEDTLGPVLKSFCGRLYFNVTQMRRVAAIAGVAPAKMLRSIGHPGALQPADEEPAPRRLRDLLSALPDIARIAFQHMRVGRVIGEHDRIIRRSLEQLSAVAPETLSDQEIWDVIDAWFRAAPEHTQVVLLLSGVLFQEAPLRAICERVGFEFERLVYPQLAAGERSVSAQQAFDLVTLANAARREPAAVQVLAGEIGDLSQLRRALQGTAFLAQFEQFLDRYGHRGRYETDWALPRYREDPTPLLLALRAHLESGSDTDVAEICARKERAAAEAWSAFEERLTRWQRWTLLPRARRAMKIIKQYYTWRERVRSDSVRVLSGLRAWHLVLAERFVERGWLDSREQYFLLHLGEIGAVLRDPGKAPTLRAIAERRAAEIERYRSIHMPLLMRESELARLIRAGDVSGPSADDGELRGQPVSGGCVEAEVVVVRDPADFGRMKRGAILVARATDPSWTPLFTLASGVIVEVGGVLSHASTIAREYGLPALANVKHATRRLKTGERVRLDAFQGRVYRVRQAEAAPALSVP
jgi:rifampicin phosphotransferase